MRNGRTHPHACLRIEVIVTVNPIAGTTLLGYRSDR